MKKLLLCLSFLALITFWSCEKINENIDIDIRPIKLKIEGQVQKGPFLETTPIQIYVLNTSFEQTGTNFITKIKDN